MTSPLSNVNTVKPLNSGHLWVFKNSSVTETCLLLGGNLTKIVTFGTKQFVRYSRHVRHYKATWTTDLVSLLWACSNKYLLGWVAFSANLISSVISLDQRKSIPDIRKWNYTVHLQSYKATLLTRIKTLYHDVKSSMTCLFRVPGAGISRHASDIRKIYQGQSFYKDKGKWRLNYQINEMRSSTTLKGLTINCLNV